MEMVRSARSNLTRVSKLRLWVDSTVSKIGGRLTKWRYVLELQSRDFSTRRDAGRAERFLNLAELTAGAPDLVGSIRGEDLAEYRKRFSENAVLYRLVTHEGRTGCTMWVKRGRDVKQWVIPLQPDDRVIYGAHTSPVMRGRGLWHQLVKSAVEQEGGISGRWLADCHVYNGASRKALERMGFSIIATKRFEKSPVPPN